MGHDVTVIATREEASTDLNDAAANVQLTLKCRQRHKHLSNVTLLRIEREVAKL